MKPLSWRHRAPCSRPAHTSNDGSMDSSLSIYSAVVNIILNGNDGHGRNSIFNGGVENYHLETNLGSWPYERYNATSITAIYTTLLPLSE
eukprot:scaffold26002_cov146-Skeletonema_marinoi.AAC.1